MYTLKEYRGMWNVSMDPPVLNLGIIQFSRQFHVLAVLVQEVKSQYLLHRRLGESPD
jgi:hypothetical protein